MELPQLGDHCTLENCKLLNFLPFRCDLCALTFCLDHRLPKAHACENYVEKDDVDPSMPKEKIKYKCELAEGCKNKELSAVICPKCDKNFCLAHRHPPDHNCHVWKEEERLRLEKHKPAKRTPVALNQRPLRSQKARQTAAKVALMKMKLHADGDKSIPQTERVYCWVAFPRNSFDGVSDPLPSQVKDKPIFFCDKWSLGRSIDFLSSRFNIQNQNNVGTARKLRLFRHEDGFRLMPLSTTFGDAVKENLIFSGSAIVLEYVDPDEDEQVVIDPTRYPL